MLMQLKQVCNHPAQYLHQVGGEEQAVASGRPVPQRQDWPGWRRCLEEALGVQ
jgi:hypothetical protein